MLFHMQIIVGGDRLWKKVSLEQKILVSDNRVIEKVKTSFLNYH